MHSPTFDGVQIHTFTHDPDFFSLDDTLASGQCFRWTRRADGWWTGVVGGTVTGIRSEGDLYSWWTYPEQGDERLVQDYFQLEVDLAAVVRRIAKADPAAGEAAMRWSGLRLLRQEPDECLLSFVCSTANSVPRIAHSIAEFSKHYGRFIGEIDGRKYHQFPSPGNMAALDPVVLSQVSSLGYRGPNIVRVAQQMVDRGPGWAASLRGKPYAEAHAELVKMHGIGAKIADCVCLFALDKTEAVPVDTHVWQLAKDLYFPDWTARKSITSLAYNTVGKAFRDRFGELAGYAQNFLFYDHFSKHWGGSSPLLKDR